METSIICEEELSKESFVERPTEDSFSNLLFRSRERAKFKDDLVTEFVERTVNSTPLELFTKKVKYHRMCYSSYANVSKVERAKKRYHAAIEAGDPSLRPKKGRPSLDENPANEGRRTRSTSEPYIKSNCVICQKANGKGKLHKVETKETGDLMLSVASKLYDKSFFRRLNTISTASDVIANDVLYHNLCWANAKKRTKEKVVGEPENHRKTLSEIELIKFVEAHLNYPSLPILDMNKVDTSLRMFHSQPSVPTME